MENVASGLIIEKTQVDIDCFPIRCLAQHICGVLIIFNLFVVIILDGRPCGSKDRFVVVQQHLHRQ